MAMSDTLVAKAAARPTSEEMLFQPVRLGRYELPHRIVMAPLTRSRARQPGNVPGPLNACYYAQHASAALIVSEATQVSMQGQGYAWTPGIHSREQVEGWRLVTEAVHRAGGLIFNQLWHVGRISHPALQPDQMLPVAPPAIKPSGQAFIENENGEGELVPFVTPRALQIEEMPYLVRQYFRGARNAMAAGFDGVEIHGANGYLLEQFLTSGTNRREDAYGGPAQNRARLLMEVVQTVIEIWGSDRVGVRLSPLSTFNDIHDDDPETTFGYAAEKLKRLQSRLPAHRQSGHGVARAGDRAGSFRHADGGSDPRDLPRHPDDRRRVRPGHRRGVARARQSGSDRVRAQVPGQSRSAGAISCTRTAQSGRSGHLLRRRRQRLYRLSIAGAGTGRAALAMRG
jgi:2,4-dienoyl-CoA reductase-like NADH-dependent reductase (Old Yellow Enzyme family)